MSFQNHTSRSYDYDQGTQGLTEKLRHLMDNADTRVNETVAEGRRGTAIGIYQSWCHFVIEHRALKVEDDVRFLAILKLPPD